MAKITRHDQLKAIAIAFNVFLQVSTLVTSAEIRDNRLHFAIEEKSVYSLDSAEIHVRKLAVTKGQPSEVGAGTTLRSDEDGQFNFRIGRQKSTEVATWFNHQCDTSMCTTFGFAAGQLNFAFLATLRLTLSYKGNLAKKHRITFEDILIAQGRSGSSNNWWFGGRNCFKQRNYQVLSRTSTDDGNDLSLSFSRGFNQVDTIAIKDVKLLSWMKNIANETLLNEINIPGTHNSATYNYTKLITRHFVRTQDLSIREQLESGIRFLDIRCRHIGNNFVIHHDRVYVHLNFDDVLDQCISFLKENPSESIVMLIKEEHEPEGNSRAFYETFLSYVEKSSEYWYRESSVPIMAAARKKIVLLHRFHFYGLHSFGINTMNWADNARFQIYRAGLTLDIQDRYDVSYDTKAQSITALLDSSRKKDQRYWYFNFISLAPSAARGTIGKTAAYTNKLIHNAIKTEGQVFVGLLVMDYPNKQHSLTSDIIYNNHHL